MVTRRRFRRDAQIGVISHWLPRVAVVRGEMSRSQRIELRESYLVRLVSNGCRYAACRNLGRLHIRRPGRSATGLFYAVNRLSRKPLIIKKINRGYKFVFFSSFFIRADVQNVIL